MPRPRKCRTVCGLPEAFEFGPLDCSLKNREPVIMTVEEYETIRLIDLEKLTQEECADRMGVARTTVQGIYMDAREKLARSLVGGLPLTIKGGDYRLCDGSGVSRGCCAQRQGMCPAEERRRREGCCGEQKKCKEKTEDKS